MASNQQVQSQREFIYFAIPVGDERTEVRVRADELTGHVASVASIYQLPVVRVDTIVTSGLITSQIVHNLTTARLVIADVSHRNPNIMYELGIAHSLQRPVIIIAENGTMLPFDLKMIRVIFFERSSSGLAAFQEKLSDAIKEQLSGVNAGSASISPVTIAGVAQIAGAAGGALQPLIVTTEDVSPTERILATLGDIRERMASIEGHMSELESRRSTSEDNEPAPNWSRKIFIVHGHDDGLKLELRNFLKDLDFEPIILHERPDVGQTIYSKLLGVTNDVGYAFILLTPDDKGNKATSDTLNPRARQNVVFEHGLFAGRLSPARVCAIVRGSVEIPSDLHGVIYKLIPDGASLTSIAIDIARELRAAGYIFDMNRI